MAYRNGDLSLFLIIANIITLNALALSLPPFWFLHLCMCLLIFRFINFKSIITSSSRTTIIQFGTNQLKTKSSDEIDADMMTYLHVYVCDV